MGPDNFGPALLLLFVLQVGAVVVGVSDAPHEEDGVKGRAPVALLDDGVVVLGVAAPRGLLGSRILDLVRGPARGVLDVLQLLAEGHAADLPAGRLGREGARVTEDR